MKRMLLICGAVAGLSLFAAAAPAEANDVRFGLSFGRYGGWGHGDYYGHRYGRYRSRYYPGYYGHGHYGRSYWHDTSHYDYHPGHFRRHRNHYHYVPGHYDYHRTGHWDHW